jgi:WD40 repeat protein
MSVIKPRKPRTGRASAAVDAPPAKRGGQGRGATPLAKALQGWAGPLAPTRAFHRAHPFLTSAQQREAQRRLLECDPTSRVQLDTAHPVSAMAFSPAGDALLIQYLSRSEVRVLNPHRSGDRGRTITFERWVQGAAFHGDSSRVVAVAMGHLEVRDLDGVALRPPRPLDGDLRRPAVSPDGNLLLLTGNEDDAQLWRGLDDRTPRLLRGHRDWIVAGSFSSDGRWALTASRDHTARLWDVANPRRFIELKGHDSPLVSARLSPHSRYVVTAAESGESFAWDLKHPVAPTLTLRASSPWFTADGEHLITSSWRGPVEELQLWSLAQPQRPLQASEGGVVEAVSPLGTQLALHGSRGSLLLDFEPERQEG